MAEVLFTLGPVAFAPGGVNLDGAALRDGWRHNFQDTIRGKGHRSYTGKEIRTISFVGVVFPGQYGVALATKLLRDIGDTGRPQQLMDGNGTILGRFVLTSLEEERAQMLPGGVGRQVSYTVELSEDPNDAL